MSKIFVGNFSFSVTEDQLKEYFSKVGNVVSAKVMTEGHGGRSRGFGFVEFSSAEDASRAITELDGSVWDGRVLKVSQDRGARSQNDRRQLSGSEGGQTWSEEGGSSRGGPIGHFRAQPLDLGIKKKKKLDPFLEDPNLVIDYKEPRILIRFMSERGRILPRRMVGLTSNHQRLIAKAIKRSQYLALLPYTRA